MKTAISIPDNLFKNAEKIAKEMGISRSELYSRAIESFIEKKMSENITRQLDKIYVYNSSSLSSILAKMQTMSLSREDW